MLTGRRYFVFRSLQTDTEAKVLLRNQEVCSWTSPPHEYWWRLPTVLNGNAVKNDAGCVSLLTVQFANSTDKRPRAETLRLLLLIINHLMVKKKSFLLHRLPAAWSACTSTFLFLFIFPEHKGGQRHGAAFNLIQNTVLSLRLQQLYFFLWTSVRFLPRCSRTDVRPSVRRRWSCTESVKKKKNEAHQQKLVLTKCLWAAARTAEELHRGGCKRHAEIKRGGNVELGRTLWWIVSKWAVREEEMMGDNPK